MGTKSTDPEKLLRAAKLAINLLELAREALWNLYPNELLALTLDDETQLATDLAVAINATKHAGENES